MNIGEKIKYLRESNHLNQSKIADYLGVKINTYSQYENNLRSPNYNTVKKISEYYKVTIDYLLDEKFDDSFAFIDFLLNRIKMTTLKIVKLLATPKEEVLKWSQEKYAKYSITIRAEYDSLKEQQDMVKSALSLLEIDDSILQDYPIF